MFESFSLCLTFDPSQSKAYPVFDPVELGKQKLIFKAKKAASLTVNAQNGVLCLVNFGKQ